MNRLASGGAKDFGAFTAGADVAQVFVAVNSGGVAIIEGDLDGVVADRGGCLRARLGLEHGQRRGGSWTGGSQGALFLSLIVASCTGALFTQIDEIVVAAVAVGPSDIHAGPARDVDVDAGGVFASLDGDRHAVKSTLQVKGQKKKPLHGFFREAQQRLEEHTSEMPSPCNLVCRLLLAKKQTH